MIQRKWHCDVGWELGTNRDCGYIGLSMPCDSYEDGVAKALAWLRSHDKSRLWYILHTFVISVRYF